MFQNKKLRKEDIEDMPYKCARRVVGGLKNYGKKNIENFVV